MSRTLEERVEALETELRRWRRRALGVAGIAVAVALLAGAGTEEVQEEIRTERLVLTDDGTPKAFLKITRDLRDQPTMAISDANDKTVAALSVEPGWVETVFELQPSNEQRAGVRMFSGESSAGLFVWDKSGWRVGKFWSAGNETKLEIVTPAGRRGFSSPSLE